MKQSGLPLEQIIRLRLLVGFLGEKRQANWWDCGFLDPTGRRFLETTFPRTFAFASIRSTSEAARLVHDSRIGRVGVFHLFRLPVDVEDQVEAHISEPAYEYVGKVTSSQDAALDELIPLLESEIAAPEGPVQIGIPKRILTRTAISELAAHYHSAFKQGLQCFPYFAPDKNGKK
jgi:hypothetical protein